MLLFGLLIYRVLQNKMKITPRVIIVMIFWMFIVTGIIFGINSLIEIPDEITGPAFFLCIGMVISSTINYYK